MRKIPKLALIVEGYDAADVAALIRVGATLPGRFRGYNVLRRRYWPAFYSTQWDTGLRFGDMMRLRTDFITGPGSYVWRQHKTAKPKILIVSAESWSRIVATYPAGVPDRELIFGFLSKNSFYPANRQLVQLAQLVGSTQHVRRGTGTAYDNAHPGQGHVHLGNDRAVFEEHYRVMRMVQGVQQPAAALPV